MTGWDEELDAFEIRLAQQWRALAAGRPQDVESFSSSPGAALGPLPARVSDRARTLAAAADALTAELAARTAAVARQLKLVSVLRIPEQAASSFLYTHV